MVDKELSIDNGKSISQYQVSHIEMIRNRLPSNQGAKHYRFLFYLTD